VATPTVADKILLITLGINKNITHMKITSTTIANGLALSMFVACMLLFYGMLTKNLDVFVCTSMYVILCPIIAGIVKRVVVRANQS